jgi:hypothetical protein
MSFFVTAPPTQPGPSNGALQFNDGGQFGGTNPTNGSVITWNGNNAFEIIDGVNGGNDVLQVALGTGENSVALNLGGAGAFAGSTIECTGPSLEMITAGPLTFGRPVGLPYAGFSQAGTFQITKASQGIGVREGGDCKQGVDTLIGGTIVVANASVTANSRIFLTAQAVGGIAGALAVTARTAGVSFTVTSSSAADTSMFAYEIFEPA